jgi:hypothetical protein
MDDCPAGRSGQFSVISVQWGKETVIGYWFLVLDGEENGEKEFGSDLMVVAMSYCLRC